MKHLILLLACLLTVMAAQAVPACPTPATVRQPDGSTLSLLLQGDEFYHFNTTADGYTVVRDATGAYTYATVSGQALTASGVVAHDAAQRTAAEVQWLAGTPRFLTSPAQVSQARKARAARDGRRKIASSDDLIDYDKFRGLVILVNFQDKKFSRSDVASFYNNMFNQRGYRGYNNEDGTGNYYGSRFIGSVRDYFYDNSHSHFDPQFTVVGPITADINCKDVNGSSGGQSLFASVIQKADAQVDFSQFDTDGDGYVDMVYFICAGYGSNYSGNDSGYLWPHMSSLWSLRNQTFDGVRMGNYASSVELYGWESWLTTNNGLSIIDGIGTVCHEFSHVLGLPDLYDTDYSGNGGESAHPGEWDVMAGGSYNEYGRRPVGYSAFEKTFLTFIQPQVLDSLGEGNYSLPALQSSGKAYVLRTPIDNEFFMFENRQQSGWDGQLPGHGLLVTRIDLSDQSVWQSNQVNVDPNHMRCEVLRAGGGTENNGSNPFPGTRNVTQINNLTTPSLRTWNGTFNQYGVNAISEANGTINFSLVQDNDIMTRVEDFETMPVTSSTSAQNVQGRFTTWNFTKSNVAAHSLTTDTASTRSAVMRRPSAITMAQPVTFNPFMATLTVHNTGTAQAKLRLQYQAPGDSTWTDATPSESVIAAGTTTTLTWNMSVNGPTLFRIYQYAGATAARLYVDNLTFSYYKSKTLKGDVNGDGVVDSSDVTALVSHILGGEAASDVTDLNEDGQVNTADVTELVQLILGN